MGDGGGGQGALEEGEGARRSDGCRRHHAMLVHGFTATSRRCHASGRVPLAAVRAQWCLAGLRCDISLPTWTSER